MKDNQRLIRTLVIVAKQIFDYEIKKNSINELIFKTESPFRYIFNIILENQTCNMEFIRTIIRDMLTAVDQIKDDYK